MVTWHDQRNGVYTSDIYAQRLDAAGAVLWTTNGVAACSATYVQEYPVIAADADGGAFIAWNDFRSAYNYDVYAQRVTGDGHVVVGVDDALAPMSLHLETYPNPFNPRINVEFTIAREERVQACLYTVDGRLVAELHDGVLPSGCHDLVWTGRDDGPVAAERPRVDRPFVVMRPVTTRLLMITTFGADSFDRRGSPPHSTG